MAQYSLVVLKVPLNANQPSYRPTYTGSDGMCVLHLRSYRPSGAKTYEEGGPIQLWQPVYSALFNSESVCLCLSLTTLSNMSNKLLLIISLKYVKLTENKDKITQITFYSCFGLHYFVCVNRAITDGSSTLRHLKTWMGQSRHLSMGLMPTRGRPIWNPCSDCKT